MTLAEAFQRREDILEAGKSVYARGRTTGIMFTVIFRNKRPSDGWYYVMLAQPHTTARAAMMPGDVRVLVK